MKLPSAAWIIGLLILVALGTTGTVLYMQSRGLRNNNPGNIRKSNANWVGLAPVQDDPAFFKFTDAVYGIRAMARILNSYRARGVDTLSKIIATWAPSNENDTAAYIASVAKRTGLASGATISRVEYPALIAAIIQHENGSQPYDTATIERGIAMA